MLSLNQKSLILLIVLLIITPSQANIPSTGAVISGSNVTLKTTGSYDKTTTQDELSTIDNAFDELLKDDFTWSTTKVTEDKPRLVTYPDGSSKLRRLVKKVSKPSKSLQDALDLDLNTSLTLNKPFPKKLQQLAQKLPEAMMNAFDAKVDQMRSKALNQAKTELLKALSLKNHWNPNKLSKAQQQELTLRANILADKYAQKAQIIFLTTLSKRGSITNRQGTIKARNKLVLTSSKNINNIGGQMQSGKDMVLDAKGDVINQTTTYSGWNSGVNSQAGIIAGNGLTMTAGGRIDNIGANLIAGDNLTMDAKDGINITTARMDMIKDRGDIDESSTKQQGSTVKSGGNFSVKTKGDLNIIGSTVDVKGEGDIQARDVNIASAVERSSRKEVTHSSDGGMFGSETTKTKTDKSSTHKKSSLSFGKSLKVKANRNFNLTASQITAKENVTVDAAENINIESGRNSEEHNTDTVKKGFVKTTTTIDSNHQETKAQAGISGNNIIFNAKQGSITKIAANIEATNDLKETAKAGIYTGDIKLKNESWHEETTSYNGIFKSLATGLAMVAAGLGIKGEMEIGKSTKDHTVKVSSSGSNLQSKNYQAETQGDYVLKGSNLTATESASIDADSVTIIAATESKETEHSEETTTIGAEGYKAENDELSVNISKTKRTKKETTNITSYKASKLNVGNLIIKSKKDIKVLGSDVKVTNDADLDSKEGNIIIADLTGSTKTTTTETEEKQTIGIGVKNAYVDAARSLDNLSKAKNALNTANTRLKEAKEKIKAGKMNPDDIKYFERNLAAAAVNLTNSTIAAAKAGASAAANSATAGFTGSINTSIKNKENTSTKTQSKSYGSSFQIGGNTKLKAKQKVAIKGSDLNTAGNTTIKAKALEVIAAKETTTETNSSKESNVSTSTSVSADMKAGDTSINADTTTTNSNSQSTTHKNTKLNSGGKLTINTDSTTIKGANVSADELDINTKKLTIASIQNTSTSKSQTDSANASGSIGATGASILGSGVSTETTKANRKYTDQQTTLIGRKKVTIKTKDLNITGATIANKDPDTYDKEGKLIHTGKDKGNLSIETETLTVTHLKNQDQSKTKGTSAGYGANISAGQTHESKDKQGQTKATIGKGKIKVNNKKDKSKLAKLNRDTDKTQTTTRDWETKRVDIKAKIDKRVFSKQGRASIAKDAKQSKTGFYDVAKDIITKDSISILDAFTHQGNKVAFFNGMQEAMQDPELRKKLANGNMTKVEKNEVLQQIAQSVADKLGIDIGDVTAINTDATNNGKEITGAHHKKSGDIVINDKNIKDSGDLVKTEGHELGHAVAGDRTGEDAEEYSDVMGDGLKDYAEFGMWNLGDGEELAKDNEHNGLKETTRSKSKNDAVDKFNQRHKGGELDYDVVIPVNKRKTDSEKDQGGWRKYKKYDFKALDYDTPKDFEKAAKEAGFNSTDEFRKAYDNNPNDPRIKQVTNGKELGTIKNMTFEAQQKNIDGKPARNSKGEISPGGDGSITGENSAWKEINNMKDGESGKGHTIKVTDPNPEAINKRILTDGNGKKRNFIDVHAGGSGASVGCITKCDLPNKPKDKKERKRSPYKNHKKVGDEFNEKIPSLRNPNENTYLYVPKRND